MLRLLLLALFVLFQTKVSLANLTPNQCLDPKTLRDALSVQMPDAELQVIAGHDAASFLAAFNALPPATQIAADAVLVIRLARSADVALAFFKNGCMVARGGMHRAAADQLLLQLHRGEV